MVCFLAAGCLFAQQVNGPFGLHRGMTKAEVISIIGRDAVTKDLPNPLGGSLITVNTAPKPFREFEIYQLYFSRADGLLKIVALGRDIDTSEDGSEVRDQYASLRTQLTSIYGAPKDIDFVKESSNELMSKPENFMLGLLDKERELSCFWSSSDATKLKDNINGVVLEARSLRLNVGYLELSYEFTGWENYVDQIKAAEGSVL
jgi:hypothetical protein